MISNGSGVILASKACVHVNIRKAFAAEAVACLQAVELGLEMGFYREIVEGDSPTVITKCQAPKINRSELHAYILNIKHHKDQFDSIFFKHVNREANKVVHLMVGKCLRNALVFFMRNVLPDFAQSTTEDDWIREPD